MPLHPELPPRRDPTARRVPPAVSPAPRRNPRRHGSALRDQLAAVLPPRQIDDGIDPDQVFKLRSAAGRLSEDALRARGISALAETADYTYFVLSRDHGERLSSALARYAAGADTEGASAPLSSLFNRLEAIEPYGPDDRLGQGVEAIDWAAGVATVDVSVWASGTYEEAVRRAGIVRAVLAAGSGSEVRADVRARRTVLRLTVDRPTLERLLATSVVERIRTPPVPFLDPSDWRTVTAQELVLDRREGILVGVLDDAPATGHPLLHDVIVGVTESGPPGHAWQQPGHHGSLVAGRVLLPHLEQQLRDHEPITAVGRVHVARILEPEPGPGTGTRFPGGDAGEPPHLTVERAIRTLHGQQGIRVFNLSVGLRTAFDAAHVGELTETLDDLARELNVVIVVPTGNAPVSSRGQLVSGHHADTDYPAYLTDPAHRLAEPGPAALVLTVGALAHSDAPYEHTPPRLGNKAIAPAGHLAPFSRTGPGIGAQTDRTNKPDLVADGGNWVLDDASQLIAEDPGVALLSTAMDSSGRLFRACCGTSFAAPAVTRCAADVLAAFPQASANLVRALVAASAIEPEGMPVAPDAVTGRRLYGAGRPDNARATNSGARRVTMTFDGAMAVDSIAIHPVPVPEAFAARTSKTRRVEAVLAFDPPVRRQRREYLAGTMQLDLYRNVDPDELAEILGRQDEDAVDLIKDRRRVKLLPSVTQVRPSTLHVRRWSPQRLDVNDGDVYHLVVTHRTQVWARERFDYDRQRYALAVTLQDEARVDLDLYAQVTQQVRVPARVRLRV